jgi:hypothetical protein
MDAPAQKRSFGETVNTWVQTIGILIAAIWGFYTFVYKEIELPSSAPVNISLNLQLKKIESGPLVGDLSAVEMKVSATNPSPRKISLLPTVWIAYGANINAARNDETTFSHAASDVLKDPSIIATQQRFADLKGFSVVAAGHLFHYNSLKPGETIGRTLVLFVPKNDYNFISVSTFMPSSEDISGIEVEWNLEKPAPPKPQFFYWIPHMYSLSKTGQRGQELTDKEFRDSVKQLDLQTAESHAEISLWP